MKKLGAFVLVMLLAACIAPQANANVRPTPTNQMLSTEQSQVTQTSSPTITSTVAMVAAPAPTAGETLTFESLDMLDTNTGWGIDTLGRIFHTSDSGDTWTLASPPDGVYTSSGFFALDGNTAWAAKDVPVRCWDYWGIYQCDQPYYAAIKSGTVWKTSDGGQSWQPSEPFSLNVDKAPYSFDGALPFSPLGLQFIDPNTGWLLVVVGQTPAGEQSLLYRTNNGGTTWEMMQTFGFEPDVVSCPKRGFTFTDANNGWLVANCPAEESNPFPTVLHTTDGGNTWSPDPQIQEMTLPSELQPADANGNLVIIEPSPVEEYFQRYPDGSLGTHLLHYFPSSDGPALAFFRLGEQMAGNWISGVKFYEARSWQSSGWMTMGSEFFFDTDHGWRLYWDLVTNGRWLQKTVDGGKTWESTKAVAWRTARFEFVNAQTGWVIVKGQAGQKTLVKTTDGGQTWDLLEARLVGGETRTENAPSTASAQDLPLTNIAELWMIDNVSGWAVTGDDQLLRTANGAQTWSNVTPPAEYKAYQDRCFSEIVSIHGGLEPEGFFALDADNAWVAQYGCAAESIAVWKTSDGGRSWRKVPLTVIPPAQYTVMPASFSPISLFFDDAAHGWLAANLYPDVRSFEEYLFRTQDGGDSWQPVSNESLPCYPTCAGVTFSAPETVWLVDDHRQTPAVSDFLRFYYSADGGRTWEEKMLFDTVPFLPVSPDYNDRIGILDWGPDFRCGTPQLRKFPDGSIGAYSSCDSDYYVPHYFSVSYLTIIAADNSFKTISAGMIVQGTTDDYGYYEFGGWTTNQSEFFYNDQLGWRLYIGWNADKNGQVYLQHTQDGGDTWETLAPVPWQDARFQFLDPQNGWALVKLPWGKALVKTTDGGKTWEEISPLIVP